MHPMPDQVNMSSSYSARTATEGDAVAMMRIATDAFNGAGNTVDSHICPERLRTATGKEDMFSYREASKRTGGFPACMDVAAMKKLQKRPNSLSKRRLGKRETKICGGAALQTIAVSPTHQRQGIGSMLIRWGQDKARDEGKEGYVLGTGPGRRLYLNAGFEDLASNGFILGEMHYSMVKRVVK
ncbi:hypothetical protein B0T25DRAFT_27592 [Lasiosphaeria hispida]|uniref:N-acetyltransferase domain-containing protein n=1 Tax=Lasiosphaeria hispida TaxID=260671 RepID=A0AAJ0HUP5_9PEZI|nr:hypothetical protein B0T25DRAFT_27592 [Lasiosphaeria hispida]